MNRRIPLLSDDSYLRYLKPGALAKLRDSRIHARSHRLNSKHRTQSLPPSPPRPPIATQFASDDVPCFASKIYGVRFPQRKKLCAAKAFYLPPSPVLDSPDPILDLFTTDFLVAH